MINKLRQIVGMFIIVPLCVLILDTETIRNVFNEVLKN